MSLRFEYPATFIQDKNGRYTVSFPDLPEALTDGADEEEAYIEAIDCLDEALANRIANELEIPVSSKPKKNQVVIFAPVSIAAKAALYLAMAETEISKSELARRTGYDVREIRRLLDPRHPTKLPRIEHALAQVGQHLAVEMRKAG